VIIGAGFAGLNAAKRLGGAAGINVTVIDRRNHHLFQPLLYQVAMAGLSPAEIARPIRSLLRQHDNIEVIEGEVTGIDRDASVVTGSFGQRPYDRLIVATGAMHHYFGRDEWEQHAPGLKSLPQATEIRRRVLEAFEAAERSEDRAERHRLLTFVIVGGGPTGVELAGAIGEMSRYTLARDFRRIDPKLTRIILVEAGDRILASFAPALGSRAARDLEQLGVQVWTGTRVTEVDAEGVTVGDERIAAATVLWAAGVKASPLGDALVGPAGLDRVGRVRVESDLSIAGDPNVFVLGDLAHVENPDGSTVPGVAPAAMQAGRFVGQLILDEQRGRARGVFRYNDKGSMATIGRRRAVLERGGLRLGGFLAWLGWLTVHIYYLSGFKNRLFVLFSWAWSYLTFARGARLIVPKRWQAYPPQGGQPPPAPPERDRAELERTTPVAEEAR
jgi:NADH dehydrogenase